jgi:hypothetical protein
MVTWTQLHADEAVLISRKLFKEPGAYNFAVPAGAKYVRASALGCGGQGDQWGGGGALARSRVMVNPGDNLKVQVGNTSTGSIPRRQLGEAERRYGDLLRLLYGGPLSSPLGVFC